MAIPGPGSKLSHFEITEKLGEGGMGVVYKARDLRLDRLVAIKVLPEKALTNADREARFVQEAKAASALNHPNIITVYEIDTANGATFIAMEYVDGKTLDQVVPRKGLRVAEALRYAVQIAEALAAAHSIGIIHRDLEPANIMITSKAAVKVLDFGLAKLVQPAAEAGGADATVTMGQPRSEEGSILGTVAYMSPEQAEGKPVDLRSDIFSFGIVLYEMLTGRRPFIGDAKLSTLAAIVNREPAPARQLVEDLPLELDRIITRCLRKNPARRFQHTADLHVALDDLKEESDSGKLSAGGPLQRRRSRTGLWASVGASVVVAAIGIWFVNRSAVITPAQTIVALTAYPGFEQYPYFSPDGNQVVFSWDGERGDNVDLYVKLLGQTDALRLTHDPGADVYPAWSPDGKTIAFQRAPSDSRFRYARSSGIYTISPLGGTEHRLADIAAEGQMSWSADGKWLAVATTEPGGGTAIPGSGLFLVSTDGGVSRQITHPKPPALDSAPAFSRSARLLAYATCTGGETCDIYLQQFDTSYAKQGSARRITNQGILIRSLAWSADEASLIYEGAVTMTENWIWQVSIQGQSAPRRLELAGASARTPAVAAKGKHLAFSRRLANYDIWRYHVGDSMEPLLVSSLTDDSPAFSPDGRKIAFISDRSGEGAEIWVANVDGSGPVSLTSHFGRHQGSPEWSPDGRWIAFDSLGRDGTWRAYVVAATGGRPKRITSDAVDENVPTWSADGQWLYLTSNRTGRSEIWRVPFAGGRSEQVTRDGGYFARLSPNGKTAFYMKSRWSGPLFAKPLAGGPERQVLPYVNLFAFVPVSDGIYYIGLRSNAGTFPLQFFEFAGGASRTLALIDGDVELGLTVSPDRKTILFTKSATSGADLMMIENFQ